MYPQRDDLINSVSHKVSQWMSQNPILPSTLQQSGGKLIRTRLAARLLQANPKLDFQKILNCCIATELVHTATLFHDDVIDGASLRRGMSTAWSEFGTNASILIGDLFFCGAISFILKTGDMRLVSTFVSKAKETCSTEIRQELDLRNSRIALDLCISIARGKTGAFFSFLAGACSSPESNAAMEEAGYRVGTAFQLMDDLIDETGDEKEIGKSLGTDRLRCKYTLAQDDCGDNAHLQKQIKDQCVTALDLLNKWPKQRDAFENFLKIDFPWIDQKVFK